MTLPPNATPGSRTTALAQMANGATTTRRGVKLATTDARLAPISAPPATVALTALPTTPAPANAQKATFHQALDALNVEATSSSLTISATTVMLHVRLAIKQVLAQHAKALTTLLISVANACVMKVLMTMALGASPAEPHSSGLDLPAVTAVKDATAAMT